MDQSVVADREQVIDTMISLTRLSKLQSAMLAGGDNMSLYLSLHRRGFMRLATPATNRVPKKQYSVGLLVSRLSLAVTEVELSQLSQYLTDAAMIAVLITSHDGAFCLGIRKKLEQLGFRIEVGVRCRQGLVLSACRRGSARMENAA